jgi:hypothetical protein
MLRLPDSSGAASGDVADVPGVPLGGRTGHVGRFRLRRRGDPYQPQAGAEELSAVTEPLTSAAADTYAFHVRTNKARLRSYYD